MKCKNCGYEVNDGINKCINCGETLTDNEDSNVGVVVSEKSYDSNNSYTLGIVASVLVIFLGIFTMSGMFTSKLKTKFDTSSGDTTYTSYNVYGGDAYTGMQNASADASNNAGLAADNISMTNKIMVETLKGYNAIQDVVSGAVGMLIMCIGIIGLSYYMIEKRKEK